MPYGDPVYQYPSEDTFPGAETFPGEWTVSVVTPVGKRYYILRLGDRVRRVVR